MTDQLVETPRRAVELPIRGGEWSRPDADEFESMQEIGSATACSKLHQLGIRRSSDGAITMSSIAGGVAPASGGAAGSPLAARSPESSSGPSGSAAPPSAGVRSPSSPCDDWGSGDTARA